MDLVRPIAFLQLSADIYDVDEGLLLSGNVVKHVVQRIYQHPHDAALELEVHDTLILQRSAQPLVLLGIDRVALVSWEATVWIRQ